MSFTAIVLSEALIFSLVLGWPLPGHPDTNTSGCTLPEVLSCGSYTIQGQVATPGSHVAPLTFLHLLCNKGRNRTVICKHKGGWSRPPICDCEEGCLLPEYPEHGKYITYWAPTTPAAVPGGRVAPYTAIQFSCDEGYRIHPATANSLALCTWKSEWNRMPTCVSSFNNTATTAIEEASEIAGCRLPDFPPHGRYEVINYPNETSPGELVAPFVTIHYSCDKGVPSISLSFCLDSGHWSQSATCTMGCKMLSSFTVDFTCLSGGDTVVTCPTLLDHGSVLEPRCKPGHLECNLMEPITCVNGRWDKRAPCCKPECGYVATKAVLHMLNASVVKINEHPWHVGVYQDFDGTITQICGGSLLYNNVIISAAHCFHHEQSNTVHPAEFFRVAAGKLFRDWDQPEEWTVQKSRVERVIVNERYWGSEQNFQNDIALLLLSETFVLGQSVHPVCLDLMRSVFNDVQLNPGNVGKVAGWGVTEDGSSATQLRSLSLPVRDNRDCVNVLKSFDFLRYLTVDKFCAGYQNGSTVCSGDSGGGLMFPQKTEGIQELWYLRGIVSNGPRSRNESGPSCENTYTAFTEVFHFKEWIKKNLNNLGISYF